MVIPGRGIPAVVSDQHASALVRAHGESGWTARLMRSYSASPWPASDQSFMPVISDTSVNPVDLDRVWVAGDDRGNGLIAALLLLFCQLAGQRRCR